MPPNNSGNDFGNEDKSIDLYHELIEKNEKGRPEFETAVYWEGNYLDGNVHDCAEVEWATLGVLYRKIGNLLKKFGVVENDVVLLMMPNMVQSPLTILAAASLGAITIPINGTETEGEVTQLIREYPPRLVICVDAWWRGDQLIRVKETLDLSLKQIESFDGKVLVIRHVGPNPGMPPPEKHLIGRRPYYLLETAMTDDRDFDWSDQFVQLDDDFPKKSLSTGNTLVKLVKWNKGSMSTRHLSIGQLWSDIMALGKSLIASSKGLSELQPSGHLCLGEFSTQFGISSFFAVLHKGLAPIVFEGVIDYPDPSRVAQIINKYQASSLLLPFSTNLDPLYISFLPLQSLHLIITTPQQNTIIRKIFPKAQIEFHQIL